MAAGLLRCVAALLLVGFPWAAHAGDTTVAPQSANAASVLVGTWQSGNFAYTFRGDGTYVYVGAMGGGATMQTRIAEEGTYRIAGQTLVINRQRGLITNSQNYRQVLEPQATTFPIALFDSPQGPTMRLTFPTGGQQDFHWR
ncbi:MAG TPA: hypothetical protein VH041_17400 [Caldimonas sp.]|nr:hypothetical protein [Caldimonas sp.]HEX4236065.1 hypothetical protein [Caldimonas sp.]